MASGQTGVCLGKTAVGLCVWAMGTWVEAERAGGQEVQGSGRIVGKKKRILITYFREGRIFHINEHIRRFEYRVTYVTSCAVKREMQFGLSNFLL